MDGLLALCDMPCPEGRPVYLNKLLPVREEN